MSNKSSLVYNNPVIPGFHPDPSLVRVGKDYYLVTSSFEYFPGVPIFHSTDLIHWRQIGHVLTRREQVDLSASTSSSGIYAPTLRYHDGTFYMVTTDVRGIGNFYVTATDPAGPWSDPITLPYGGIDPSLFFDDDGKVYATVQNSEGYDSHIIQYEIDPSTGKALTEPVKVWQDPEGPWTEGAHLYKINGTYYMMSAAGGTSFEHREVIGRSDNPNGPFEPCPVPILTHRGLRDHEIQCMGHGELIDDVDGNWWMLFLATRPLEGKYSVLGRETFLAPVYWKDGWPLIDNNEGTVNTVMRVEGRSLGTAATGAPATANGSDASSTTGTTGTSRPFGADPVALSGPFGPEWSFLRVYDEASYAWEADANRMRVHGNRWNLDDEAPANFASIRQRHHRMRLEATLAFKPVHDGEEAGLALRLNNRGYLFWGVKRIDGKARLCLTHRNGDELNRHLADIAADANDVVKLAVASDGANYTCSWSIDGNTWHEVSVKVPMSTLSPETNGGFTGVCVGIYASGDGADAATPAYFSDFNYAPQP